MMTLQASLPTGIRRFKLLVSGAYARPVMEVTHVTYLSKAEKYKNKITEFLLVILLLAGLNLSTTLSSEFILNPIGEVPKAVKDWYGFRLASNFNI